MGSSDLTSAKKRGSVDLGDTGGGERTQDIVKLDAKARQQRSQSKKDRDESVTGVGHENRKTSSYGRSEMKGGLKKVQNFVTGAIGRKKWADPPAKPPREKEKRAKEKRKPWKGGSVLTSEPKPEGERKEKIITDRERFREGEKRKENAKSLNRTERQCSW